MYRAIGLALLTVACTQPSGSNQTTESTNTTVGSAIQKKGTQEISAADGPFGYVMGQSIDRLGLEKMDRPGYYRTSTPPKPHDDFESVVIEAYPETGICLIRGVGKDIDGDGSGATVRGKVQELAEALATRYGEGKKLDNCSGGDVQCDSQFWMMTLEGGERYYGYEWMRQTEKMKTSDIGSIDVGARAGSISTSYALIEYNSSNKATCDNARRASSASSL